MRYRAKLPGLLAFIHVVVLLVTVLAVPPAVSAGELGEEWLRRIDTAQEHLEAGRYPQALEMTSTLMADLAPSIVAAGDAEENLLGTLHALHAFALAGTGDERWARWHWILGQSLAPSFAHTSLASYGEAGQLLEPYRLAPGGGCRLAEEVADGGEAPLEVGGEVEAPSKLRADPPRYSERAREAKVTGVVVLRALIDEEGSVVRVCVLRAVSPALAHQAAEAMKDWRFKPATRGGEPVTVYYNLTTNFTLG